MSDWIVVSPGCLPNPGKEVMLRVEVSNRTQVNVRGYLRPCYNGSKAIPWEWYLTASGKRIGFNKVTHWAMIPEK